MDVIQADSKSMDSRFRGNDGSAETSSDVPRQASFSQGPGRVLLDGGFRREIAEADAVALLPLARKRYLELMTVRPSAGSG